MPLEHNAGQRLLKLIAQLFRFVLGAATLDHFLPRHQVWIVLGRLGQKPYPALEQFVIQLVLLHYHGQLRFFGSGHFPNRLHVLGGLKRQRLAELFALRTHEIAQQLFARFNLFLVFLVFLVHALRHQRILVIHRVQENPRERVVILGRDGIVLMVVATRAAYCQTQESARHNIYAIVPLIGARHFHRAVVVEPRSLAQESERGKHFRARVFFHEIGRQLGLHENVERHVVVERFDHPVAVEIRLRIGIVAAAHRIQAPVVVFAEARDIQPESAPPLAILRRCEQPIHNLGERFGRLVLFKRLDLFEGGRKAG